ncbi:MAG: hypothetical protein U0736_28155 [Gemmataceae bacterium]
MQARTAPAPALARVLAGSSPRLRLEAARLLAGLGVDVRPATAELRQAAEGDDKRLQQAVCAALATLGLDAVPRSVGERPRQREAWARLVGHVGVPARSLTGRLRELLADPEAPVRAQAALALWRVDGQADAARGADGRAQGRRQPGAVGSDRGDRHHRRRGASADSRYHRGAGAGTGGPRRAGAAVAARAGCGDAVATARRSSRCSATGWPTATRSPG